jgi:hypothetical protein
MSFFLPRLAWNYDSPDLSLPRLTRITGVSHHTWLEFTFLTSTLGDSDACWPWTTFRIILPSWSPFLLSSGSLCGRPDGLLHGSHRCLPASPGWFQARWAFCIDWPALGERGRGHVKVYSTITEERTDGYGLVCQISEYYNKHEVSLCLHVPPTLVGLFNNSYLVSEGIEDNL